MSTMGQVHRSPPPSTIKKGYASSIAESAYAESTTDTIFQVRPASCPPDAKLYDDDDGRSLKGMSLLDADYASQVLDKPTRVDLNKVVGDDMIPHTTEIASFPCAGIRISQGPLAGLVAWRFVVQKDERTPAFRTSLPGVVVNFILDTGATRSIIPQDALRALGYENAYRAMAGKEVMLLIQGIRTKVVVGQRGEMGRLSGQFMFAGNLAFYFDAKLDAPVLYASDDEHGNAPSFNDIPRTVARSFSVRVLSMINLARYKAGC